MSRTIPTLQKELEALADKGGVIHAESVVAWAKDHPRSALHRELEWDNEAAGYQWRLQQARRLIALNVVDESGERKTISLTVDRSKGGGYRRVEDVARSKNLRQIMLNDALGELRRVKAKYDQLQELARVFTEIDIVDRRYGKKDDKAA